ncbi:helix-turn-helix domain-containing protein [Iningainema tapete]|uniref:Helix-turn-helix transcriptional regulator n=1 Tax=Iningainema tapete BLCC-T55 TaxID=2748662 RepID=A0A8J7BWH4_9CYAN|nr:helix-turn-helix transcriptional regulator [Iningainema tapete]MBD2770958.1 helix-turn-helix transcriptional regulator [Iningainema tapete BLCC-T55]
MANSDCIKINYKSSSAEDLCSLVGLAKKPAPVTKPPLFQTTDDAPVMTSHPYLSGAQACLGKTLWDTIEGIPCFRRFFGQGFIEHNIIKENPETNRIELVAGNAAWEIIQKFNPEVAYMFLVFASCATDLDQPWSGAFTIKGTDLIKTFGWSNRTDLSLGNKLKKLGHLALQVAHLSITINELDLKRMKYSAEIQAMWRLKLRYEGDVSPTVEHNQPNKVSNETDEPTELFITVGANDWVRPFQDLENYRSLYEYGLLAKSTLQINPYQNPMAAKLAVFLTIMSRIKIDGEYKVETLLKRIGYLSEIQLQELQSKSNRYKRKELIEQWDNALLTLQDLGWQISFEPVTYPESIQPNWTLPDDKHTEGKRRPDKWLDIWLEAKVIIKPTAKIQEKLEAINAPALPISKPKPEQKLQTVLTESKHSQPTQQQDTAVEDSQKLIPGWALSEALKLRGWTKSHLAERLGLQKSLPGKWINGTRKIQPLHQKLLWEWLAPELNQVMSD